MLDSGVHILDIAAMAANLPRDSVTILKIQPKAEIEEWDSSAWLLAQAVDILSGANWQRGGGRGPKPKPVKRPKPPRETTADEGLEIEDFKAWYAAQPGGRHN